MENIYKQYYKETCKDALESEFQTKDFNEWYTKYLNKKEINKPEYFESYYKSQETVNELEQKLSYYEYKEEKREIIIYKIVHTLLILMFITLIGFVGYIFVELIIYLTTVNPDIILDGLAMICLVGIIMLFAYMISSINS